MKTTLSKLLMVMAFVAVAGAARTHGDAAAAAKLSIPAPLVAATLC